MIHEMVTEGRLLSHTKILVKWVPENVLEMSISFLLHKYCLNHGLIRCFSNWLERVDPSRRDLDRRKSSWNLCDAQIQNFRAQLFQIQNYSPAQYFRKYCCLQGLTLTFFCAMPRSALVGEIWGPSVKYDKAPDVYWWYPVTAIPPNIAILPDFSTTTQTDNLYSYTPDGYLWVHRNSVICVPPEINTYFSTLFWVPKENPKSPCPRISMEPIAWLACMMRFSLNRVILIAIFSSL